jgi:hypothetical protein
VVHSTVKSSEDVLVFEAGSNRLNASLQTGSYQPGEISTNTEEHLQAVLINAQHVTKIVFQNQKS